jgi:SPP1 family predicted phage head-tail adaptor
MPAGAYRDVIDIEEPTETNNAFGEPVATWAAMSSGSDIRAEVKDLQGRELEQAKATHADVSVRVKLRYFSGLTPKKRFKQKPSNRYLQIESVANPDGRQIEHVCLCKQEV